MPSNAATACSRETVGNESRNSFAELTTQAESLDPSCRQALEPLYAANAEKLDPLRTLMEATHDRIKAAAARAGGPHA